jgi:hypothetical protein
MKRVPVIHYIIQLEIHKNTSSSRYLIPFGIRSQSCFLILPASESLIEQEVWNRLYHVIRGKSDHVTYFQNNSKWRHSMDLKRRLGMMSCITQKHLIFSLPNPFWDSKPELFSDIACLWIPYQPCIVQFGKFLSGTPTSNWHELRLHLNT